MTDYKMAQKLIQTDPHVMCLAPSILNGGSEPELYHAWL